MKTLRGAMNEKYAAESGQLSSASFMSVPQRNKSFQQQSSISRIDYRQIMNHLNFLQLFIFVSQKHYFAPVLKRPYLNHLSSTHVISDISNQLLQLF